MIQRYDIYGTHGPVAEVERDDGEYVLYEDHQKEVKRLREALERIITAESPREMYDEAKEALDG